ncbi:cupin domain-containing protein [Hoeflea alexandrii]|uniref:Cupin n=1 Tax=Hoeflea alexandrii TaxID=288436 RepID=A0ABT1CVH8_9HYPH|nr:cupin domain-containing protein [Hoeflea alexandrii]MCO6409943.1 cupin [Hoeflea alexandrii]MCY0152934.1 cupin domain-containing protein [Hoeflea alexandrii]
MTTPTAIRTDFTRTEIVDTAAMDWIASPSGGVDRKPLDRIGGEVARATSLVRYAPGSDFPSHTHNGGEEFLVVEGIFSDQHGDYGPGTYVRNPVGTSHAPGSRDGCTILVKLWQFEEGDTAPVVIDTASAEWQAVGQGIERLHLHRYKSEKVAMLRFSDGGSLRLPEESGGVELYLLDGRLQVEGQSLSKGGWARLPAGMAVTLSAPGTATLYIKTGHLDRPVTGPDA